MRIPNSHIEGINQSKVPKKTGKPPNNWPKELYKERKEEKLTKQMPISNQTPEGGKLQ